MLPRVRAGPAGSRFSHEAATTYHSLQNPRTMYGDCKDSRNADPGCHSRPPVGARCSSASPCSSSFMPCRDWEILVETEHDERRIEELRAQIKGVTGET